MNGKKILVSGVKPTGTLHVGNYFGAVRQLVGMQSDHDGHVFIANYHAMTTVQDKSLLEKQTIDMAINYIAIGLDPEKTTLFLQSDVPEVAELTWIFNCITTAPYLMRAHAYKDAVENGREVNVGLFDYPVLMASDILVQDADVVPVGQDQKQHVEYARDIAEKFNRIYEKEVFKLPEPVILENVAVVRGVDGRKMSKSYDNIIPLLGTDEELKKAVMLIVTDSKSVEDKKDPNACNIFALHKLFSEHILVDIEDKYKSGGFGYGDSKKLLLENIIKFVEPMRSKREELIKKPDFVRAILREGGKKANERAKEKMKEVREVVGIWNLLDE